MDAGEPVAYRRAVPDDSKICHDLMWESVTDLGRRQGTPLEGTAEEWWRSSEPLQRLLATIGAEWWVAEEPGSGRLVGFARSIERDGLLELTEFFVHPDQQARGVGQSLLNRAFPTERGTVRSIIATLDVRAEFSGLACADVAECPDLMRREVPRPLFGEFLFVLSKDIGDFWPMFAQARSTSRSLSASKGLGIFCRCAVETRR